MQEENMQNISPPAVYQTCKLYFMKYLFYRIFFIYLFTF